MWRPDHPPRVGCCPERSYPAHLPSRSRTIPWAVVVAGVVAIVGRQITEGGMPLEDSRLKTTNVRKSSMSAVRRQPYSPLAGGAAGDENCGPALVPQAALSMRGLLDSFLGSPHKQDQARTQQWDRRRGTVVRRTGLRPRKGTLRWKHQADWKKSGFGRTSCIWPGDPCLDGRRKIGSKPSVRSWLAGPRCTRRWQPSPQADPPTISKPTAFHS
jgi:hypothetical protein